MRPNTCSCSATPRKRAPSCPTGLATAPPGPARVPGLLLAATIASWEFGDATVAELC